MKKQKVAITEVLIKVFEFVVEDDFDPTDEKQATQLLDQVSKLYVDRKLSMDGCDLFEANAFISDGKNELYSTTIQKLETDDTTDIEDAKLEEGD